MNGIVVKNLRKDFFTLRRGRIRALATLDLTVEPGAFFVLVGPSGCGKSTLLNIIAGIENPSAGDIWIGDRQVMSVAAKKFLPPRRRDVAMVFQSYALYPHMTVFANIAFPLKIAGVDRRDIDNRVRAAAATLEIENLLDARPAELSGGQRQRVALGRAIVRRPRVLLLDEPLSNLDALLRTSMRGELKQIQRRLAVTTIYVTHDQTEAMTLGDRIAVLKDGRLQQTGTPEEIYHRPANSFVAGFIGTLPMNLLDGGLLAKAQRRLEVCRHRGHRPVSNWACGPSRSASRPPPTASGARVWTLSPPLAAKRCCTWTSTAGRSWPKPLTQRGCAKSRSWASIST